MSAFLGTGGLVPSVGLQYICVSSVKRGMFSDPPKHALALDAVFLGDV